MLADNVRPVFAWVPLLTMLVVLGTSLVMYVMLVRRWTSRRQWVSLGEWTRHSGFRIQPLRRDLLPGPLRRSCHVRRAGAVSPLRCAYDAGSVRHGSAAPRGRRMPRWNVLIRSRPAGRNASGLRPASRDVSLIDLLPLCVTRRCRWVTGSSFTPPNPAPRGAGGVTGPDASALRRGAGPTGGSPGAGFLLRPFDPIEFGRTIALAEQLGMVL